jgi:hypothetical protein
MKRSGIASDDGALSAGRGPERYVLLMRQAFAALFQRSMERGQQLAQCLQVTTMVLFISVLPPVLLPSASPFCDTIV